MTTTMERYVISVGKRKGILKLVPKFITRNNNFEEPILFFKSSKGFYVTDFVNMFKHFFLKKVYERAVQIQIPVTVSMSEGMSGCRDYFLRPVPRFDRIRFNNPVLEDYFESSFHVTMSNKIQFLEVPLRSLPVILYILARDYQIDVNQEVEDLYISGYDDAIYYDLDIFNSCSLTVPVSFEDEI